MAALQWALTSHLRKRNARIARYMSDVEAWARRQFEKSVPACHCHDSVHIQLGCEGIAKVLFFIRQDRLIVFWLHEFLRENVDADDSEFTVH
jgi:hypothetical protein